MVAITCREVPTECCEGVPAMEGAWRNQWLVTCPPQRRAEGTLMLTEKIQQEVTRIDLSMCSAGLVYLASSAAADFPDAFSLAVQYGLGICSDCIFLFSEIRIAQPA